MVLKKKVKKQRKHVLKWRYSVPLHIKMLVTQLYYGSDSDFSVKNASYAEIQRRVGLKQSTLRMIVKRFRDNNYSHDKPRKARGRKKKLSSEMLQYVTSQDILQQQAAYALRMRCRIFKLRFHLRIHPSTLRRYYINNGIKYKKVNYTKASKHKKAREIQEQCYRYAREVVELKSQKRAILYLDQTNFNPWNIRLKTWQHPLQQLQFIQSDAKVKNFTLYGGITEAGFFYYSI